MKPGNKITATAGERDEQRDTPKKKAVKNREQGTGKSMRETGENNRAGEERKNEAHERT